MARIAYRQPKFHGHDEPYLFITYRIIHDAISGLDESSDIVGRREKRMGRIPLSWLCAPINPIHVVALGKPQ
jgi:hypothetical protein